MYLFFFFSPKPGLVCSFFCMTAITLVQLCLLLLLLHHQNRFMPCGESIATRAVIIPEICGTRTALPSVPPWPVALVRLPRAKQPRKAQGESCSPVPCTRKPGASSGSRKLRCRTQAVGLPGTAGKNTHPSSLHPF